jgi:hypothetical protein
MINQHPGRRHGRVTMATQARAILGLMLQKIDIDHAARYLIANRGVCAQGRAAKRAQDLAHEGNGDGSVIWGLIAERIKTIRDQTVATEVHQVQKMARGDFTVIEGGRR